MYRTHQEQFILKVYRVLFVSTASGHQKLLREEPHLSLLQPYPGAAAGSKAVAQASIYGHWK